MSVNGIEAGDKAEDINTYKTLQAVADTQKVNGNIVGFVFGISQMRK